MRTKTVVVTSISSCLVILFLSLSSCFPYVSAGRLYLEDAKIDSTNRAPKFFNVIHQSSSTSTPPEELADQRQAYIVYMGGKIQYGATPQLLYTNMLKDVIGSNELASKYLLRTYGKSFYGCVAMLTLEEANAISKMDGVVSVFPNRKMNLHTTRSWDFIGLPLDTTRNLKVERDIIIGMLDTGVWPEAKSFDDTGLGPVPARWKGKCDHSFNFTCNRKVIGAQYFRSDNTIPEPDLASPRDTQGHGTHTASTAAGAIVNSVNYFGFSKGKARGGVPSARIAVYKVCWSDSCFNADILAACDTAIADGVDMLSVSLGSSFAQDYSEDPIAICSFHAMKKGIFTSVSGGNAGPSPQTISNVAPWTLSVAASTIDRSFSTGVQLSNGIAFKGFSINPHGLHRRPLIYSGDAQNSSSKAQASFCDEGSLNRTLVKGKIVLCAGLNTGGEPFQAGAAGMLTVDGSTREAPFSFPLPAADMGFDDALKTLAFIVTQKSLKGTIHRSTEAKNETAPFVAPFSSRGPNPISPGILKPDISAPGVNIIAAWSPMGSPSVYQSDKRSVKYNIISGTSMACPHATGVAAYVKSFHPSWSPSAIKSAIMTSATPMKSSINEDAEFAYGAGHINPQKARNPGLVYDTGVADYTKFLCGEGFDSSTMQTITGVNNTKCPEKNNGTTGYDLNYPSIALFSDSGTFHKKFKRIVTNVGVAKSIYKVKVQMALNPVLNQSIRIKVVPNKLHFRALGQKKTFRVTLKGVITPDTTISASIVWDDCTHQVRSPIVVYRFS